MTSNEKQQSKKKNAQPDYYIEKGLYVFTEAYHLKRGYCCHNGCRHCPWAQSDTAFK